MWIVGQCFSSGNIRFGFPIAIAHARRVLMDDIHLFYQHVDISMLNSRNPNPLTIKPRVIKTHILRACGCVLYPIEPYGLSPRHLYFKKFHYLLQYLNRV